VSYAKELKKRFVGSRNETIRKNGTKREVCGLQVTDTKEEHRDFEVAPPELAVVIRGEKGKLGRSRLRTVAEGLIQFWFEIYPGKAFRKTRKVEGDRKTEKLHGPVNPPKANHRRPAASTGEKKATKSPGMFIPTTKRRDGAIRL